jgi:opacity protein-like surface antigen
MKKLIFGIALITVLASVVMLAGCVRVDIAEKNGPITTQQYDFKDFTGIQVGNAFELEVIKGASYNVTITAGKNVLDRIRVAKTGGTLVIDIDGWSFIWRSSPVVTVTMPDLTSLDLSGASHANIQGFNSTHDFHLKLSGASVLDMDMETGNFVAKISGASAAKGRLTATGADIDLSGASNIELTGSCRDLKLHSSGASHAALSYFTVSTAVIEFTGASHGTLDVSGRLDVDLSGASSLDYLGNPVLGKIDVSGASDLEYKTSP